MYRIFHMYILCGMFISTTFWEDFQSKWSSFMSACLLSSKRSRHRSQAHVAMNTWIQKGMSRCVLYVSCMYAYCLVKIYAIRFVTRSRQRRFDLAPYPFLCFVKARLFLQRRGQKQQQLFQRSTLVNHWPASSSTKLHASYLSRRVNAVTKVSASIFCFRCRVNMATIQDSPLKNDALAKQSASWNDNHLLGS